MDSKQLRQKIHQLVPVFEVGRAVVALGPRPDVIFPFANPRHHEGIYGQEKLL